MWQTWCRLSSHCFSRMVVYIWNTHLHTHASETFFFIPREIVFCIICPTGHMPKPYLKIWISFSNKQLLFMLCPPQTSWRQESLALQHPRVPVQRGDALPGYPHNQGRLSRHLGHQGGPRRALQRKPSQREVLRGPPHRSHLPQVRPACLHVFLCGLQLLHLWVVCLIARCVRAGLDPLRSLSRLMSSQGAEAQATAWMRSEARWWIMSLRCFTLRSSRVTQTGWSGTWLSTGRWVEKKKIGHFNEQAWCSRLSLGTSS